MKTEIILQRDLNGSKIRQLSKSGFFCANDLLNLYNQNSNIKKRIDIFLANNSTQEFIQTIILDEIKKAGIVENQTTRNSCELEKYTNKAIFTKEGKNGGTWMHPYLFIDFAMWLSADFKLECMKWLYDKLLENRNDAGDYYKEMMGAIKEVYNPTNFTYYTREAEMLNKLVFGNIQAKNRDEATSKELDKLNILQKANIKMIGEKKDYHTRYVELNKIADYL